MDPRTLVFVESLMRTEDRNIRIMTNGERYFVEKRVRTSKTMDMERLKREISTWKKLLNVEGVVPYEYASIRTNMIIVVTEFWRDGDLHSFIMDHDMTLEEVCQIFYCVAAALFRMHCLGIAHRDIKLENVLIRPSTRAGFAHEIGIIDFGLSVCSEGLQNSAVGTISYAAPEVWLSKSTGYNPFVADAWSLGVLLFAMIDRTFPFQGETPSEISREINKPPKWHSWNNPDIDPLVSLLNGLLTLDTAERMTIKEVVQSPFLRKHLPYDLIPLDVDGESLRSLSSDAIVQENVIHNRREQVVDTSTQESKKERKISPRSMIQKVRSAITKN